MLNRFAIRTSSFPFRRQLGMMDCGPACLQMIAAYYGRTVSLQVIRDHSQIGHSGVNLLGLSEAANRIGFTTQAVQVDLESLTAASPFPCILHWNQRHFIVLYKESKGIFHIADPSSGRLRLKREDLAQRWAGGKGLAEDGEGLAGDGKGLAEEGEGPAGYGKGLGDNSEGIALLLEPSSDWTKTATPDMKPDGGPSAFKKIVSFFATYKKQTIQLGICLFISTLLQYILPFLTQRIVDNSVRHSDIHLLTLILLGQAAILTGKLVVDLIKNWILLHVSTRISISILEEFLQKLMRLPISFFASRKTGDILQRMSDHQRVESFLTGTAIQSVFSLFSLLLFSAVLLAFYRSTFIVFATCSLLYIVWTFQFLRHKKLLDYKRFNVLASEQGVALQIVQGMQDIKLNGVEKIMYDKWAYLQSEDFRLNKKKLSLERWQQTGTLVLNEGKNLLISYLSARAVIRGEISLGAMLAVQYIVGQLNGPIDQLLGMLQSWQAAKISMDRLSEVQMIKDEEEIASIRPDPGMAALTAARKDMVLSNVSFRYPGAGNPLVLKDIDLIIPHGKRTAIVGVSGSGKTSLLKLLLRFYDPEKGSIFLGDDPLSGFPHSQWRSRCATVLQESVLFSASIAENIAMGEAAPDPEKLRQAIRVANLEAFVDSLPNGTATIVGPDEMGVSMGQKQRLLIARAAYRDPEFVFLDEATNSLDATNEGIISDNLSTFFKGKTTVIVAHRLSTVRTADQIVVLHNGRISERGTHRELVALKGDYFELVRNQLELGA